MRPLSNLASAATGVIFCQLLTVSPGAVENPAEIAIVEPPFKPAQSWTYDPATVEVKVGGTITWRNTGAVVHTVTADDGKSFNSGNMPKNASFSFSASAPGIFAYHCKYHPWMKGKIMVAP